MTGNSNYYDTTTPVDPDLDPSRSFTVANPSLSQSSSYSAPQGTSTFATTVNTLNDPISTTTATTGPMSSALPALAPATSWPQQQSYNPSSYPSVDYSTNTLPTTAENNSNAYMAAQASNPPPTTTARTRLSSKSSRRPDSSSSSSSSPQQNHSSSSFRCEECGKSHPRQCDLE